MKKKTKKLLSAVLMLLGCLICLVGLSFAWYSGQGYTGYGGQYAKNLIIGGTKSTITNYIGTVTEDEVVTITYTEVNSTTSFDVDNLYPGARQYFKTVIQNAYATQMSYSIYISQILYDSPLKDFVSVKVTAPSPLSISLGNMQYTKEGDDIYSVKSIRLCDKYVVSAGESFEIYWYVEISEGAGNDCTGKELTIRSIDVGN